jgi:indolepyruvate decarboxylase
MEAAKKPPAPVPVGALPEIPCPATGALTYTQVFERIAAMLNDSWITIPDTFLGVCSAANLPVMGRDAFLCSGIWASIGHSVAAAVGASLGSNRRPLVICGDGGFHMTAQTLSTMVQHGCDPVIVVIANGIHGYEQFLLDPSFFADPARPPRGYAVLNQWDFVKFANALGVTFAQAADTAVAFDTALAAATVCHGPALIAAHVNSRDLPAELC